jgi:phenylacetate-coenzyme A ligase PaaK-like adenylate-forming protein
MEENGLLNKTYFSRKLETMPAETIKALQFEKTKATLERAYHKSPFYRDLFDKARVKPESGNSRTLPLSFIEKQDM